MSRPSVLPTKSDAEDEKVSPPGTEKRKSALPAKPITEDEKISPPGTEKRKSVLPSKPDAEDENISLPGTEKRKSVLPSKPDAEDEKISPPGTDKKMSVLPAKPIAEDEKISPPGTEKRKSVLPAKPIAEDENMSLPGTEKKMSVLPAKPIAEDEKISVPGTEKKMSKKSVRMTINGTTDTSRQSFQDSKLDTDEKSIKKKLRAAAYDHGGVCWRTIFKERDKDHDGCVDFDEFRTALRDRPVELAPQDFSDAGLKALFRLLAKSSDKLLNYEQEFLPWLDPYGHAKRDAIEEERHKPKLLMADAESRKSNTISLVTAGKLKGFAKRARESVVVLSNQRKNAGLNPKVLAFIRKKLRVAAYHQGKVNWKKLFRYYDRDNSGSINFDEFRQAIRKDAKVSPEMLSEHKLRLLYKMVDTDGGGTIDYMTEFVPWLEMATAGIKLDEQGMGSEKKKLLAKDWARAETQRIEEIGMLSQANAAYVKARALLPFLLRWMNCLLDDPTQFTMSNFTQELQSGLLLLDVVRLLCPKADFGPGIYIRPISRPMCVSNIEKALSAARRYSLNMGNMCSPDAFYEGRVMQMARALYEMFNSLYMRRVNSHIKSYIREIDSILAPMGRPLQEKTLSQPLLKGHYMLSDFGDCTRIMALLVACDRATPDDMAELYGNPTTMEMLLHNAEKTNRALGIAGCPVLLDGREWSNPPCWDFNLMGVQIYETWDRLRFQETLSSYDGEPLRLSANALREAGAKAFEATEKAQAAEPGLPPLPRSARDFGLHVRKLGDDEKIWGIFDSSRNGCISMTEFVDGARRTQFKGNVKSIFMMIDVDRSGHIDRDELFHYIEASMKPPTEEELAREAEEDEILNQEKWKQEIDKRRAGKRQRERRRRMTMDVALQTEGVIELVKHLKRYPNIDEAFALFDVFGTGTVTMSEFRECCSKLRFKTDPKALFFELDLNRSGILEKKEFIAIVQDRERREKHDRLLSGQGVIDILVDWPTQNASVLELAQLQDVGELRFPGVEEEREWLMLEDGRRCSDMIANGMDKYAEKIYHAARDGVDAVEDFLEQESTREVDVPELGAIQDVQEFSRVSTADVVPTVNIPARVVLGDSSSSEQPVWLQTAVVDRSGRGRVDADLSVFVLEIRARTNSVLLAQLDVARIESIEQVGTSADGIRAEMEADVEFVLTAGPEANILDITESWDNLCSLQSDGSSLVRILGGPSYWRRRNSVLFFDELKVLVHFIRGSDASTEKGEEEEEEEEEAFEGDDLLK